ncbi:MAG: universal stress protein [bacterium]
MLPIKKILVPISGSDVSLSDVSLEALNYTSSLVRESDITVYLMTVIENNQSIYDAYEDQTLLAQRKLKTFSLVNGMLVEAEKKAKDMGMQSIITVANLGTPHQQITRMAADVKIDLIVMGTHGHSGITRLLAGSVTEEVIKTAPCPVVIVRPHEGLCHQ